jgi:Tol biopolymer transport system component
VWSGCFAPDGQTIVYSAAWDGDVARLYSTRPDWTETRTLPLPPAKVLAISRKSELAFLTNTRNARFFSQPGTLVQAGLEAGAEREILEGVTAADWSPDGARLAIARRVGDHSTLEYPMGKVLYETPGAIGTVRISRDGSRVAFSESLEGAVSISVVPTSGGSARVLSRGWFPSATGLAWSADGREIWFSPQRQVRDRSPALLAVTLSGKQREVVTAPGQLRLFDIAADGRVLAARWDVQVGVRGAQSSANRDRELSATDDSRLADLARDGRSVLFFDRHALFLRGMDGSAPIRLGVGLRDGQLSPDGERVLCVTDDESSNPVLVPVGAGEVRRIRRSCDRVEWLPDGKRILCEIPNSHGTFRLLEIELDSGEAKEIPIAPAEASDIDRGVGPVSPDGTVLAVIGRRGDLLILPLTGGAIRRIPEAGPALERGLVPAGWTADSRQLFVHRPGDLPDRVQKLDLETGRLAPWKELTLDDLAGIVRIDPVLFTPDGRSWAYSYNRILSNLYVVEGLK